MSISMYVITLIMYSKTNLHLRSYEDTAVPWAITATSVATQLILHMQKGPGQDWFAPNKILVIFQWRKMKLKKCICYGKKYGTKACVLPHD